MQVGDSVYLHIEDKYQKFLLEAIIISKSNSNYLLVYEYDRRIPKIDLWVSQRLLNTYGSKYRDIASKKKVLKV